MKSSLIIAISLFALLFSTQAAAQTLESCIAIEDTSERLACYDRLAGRLPADKAKAGGAESSSFVIVPAVPVEESTATTVKPASDEEAVFGLERCASLPGRPGNAGRMSQCWSVDSGVRSRGFDTVEFRMSLRSSSIIISHYDHHHFQ